jgi:hypothetical protein
MKSVIELEINAGRADMAELFADPKIFGFLAEGRTRVHVGAIWKRSSASLKAALPLEKALQPARSDARGAEHGRHTAEDTQVY